MQGSNVKTYALVDKLISDHRLEVGEYEQLIRMRDEQVQRYAAQAAVACSQQVYGKDVFVRGLIEFSSYCKNDCFYCGLRCSNARFDRYRLTQQQICSCADEGYDLGFRTFVLQSGEDTGFGDVRLCEIISALKCAHPDCAITLSVGERPRDVLQQFRDAGADRYLLRHETADKSHYQQLHPASMSYDNRMKCIADLREVGFTVGVGFMVGTPGQTAVHLAEDLKFIEQFKPEMCGIGPFVPHHATPFAQKPKGSVQLTCFLLSLLRLIQPNLLLPATTSLGTLDENGREKGILSGANVVMPNLSPVEVRSRYDLYDNKVSAGAEAAQGIADLAHRMKAIGYRIVVDRGDPRPA